MNPSIIKGIYAITPDWMNTDLLIKKTEEVLTAGVDVIQYRNKIATHDLKLSQAKEIKALCNNHKTPLIINDDIDLCRILNADGIHLGENDCTIDEVRNKLGDQVIVGISCYSNLSRVQKMLTTDCNYIAVGACYPTTTKPDAPQASKSFISHVLKITTKPVVAIGGINLDNCESLLKLGVNSVAMINSIFYAEDVKHTINQFRALASKYD